MNWQGVSADLPVALILMIGAAILGGLIIWLIKQWGYRTLKAEYDQKIGELGELNNRHDLLSTKHDDLEDKYNRLNTTYLDIQEKYDVQRRQLKDCSTKRAELESKVTILTPFRKKFEDLEPQYKAARIRIDDLNGEVKSLTVKSTGLEDALKDERKENMDLKTSLSLTHGLQGKYDDSQKEIEELKAKIAQMEIGDVEDDTAAAQILARIGARAQNINFDKIGFASINDKQDLKVIKGIGPFIEKKLNALNIFTYRQIAKFDKDDIDQITDAIEFFPGRIERDNWVPQAKGLMGGKSAKEAATLARIQARAEEVNFDRIGVATADMKDDLKLVKGIGPFIEKKLNSIGIYTFEQISRFTPEDEDKVNEVIEFFPGRIRRDGWSKQAKDFSEKKKEEKNK